MSDNVNGKERRDLERDKPAQDAQDAPKKADFRFSPKDWEMVIGLASGLVIDAQKQILENKLRTRPNAPVNANDVAREAVEIAYMTARHFVAHGVIVQDQILTAERMQHDLLRQRSVGMGPRKAGDADARQADEIAGKPSIAVP